MDNNVGQNKSQVVLMFYCMMSMTLFPAGIILHFLLPGHSHMAPDRCTGWHRKSIKGHQIYSPEELVAAINTVKSVIAKFVDHRLLDSPMFRGWENILKSHFYEIPYLPKINGYTSCHFFETKNGSISMKKTVDSEVLYTHQYVRGIDGTCTKTDMENCRASLERCLFGNKTFDTATVEDIVFSDGNNLIRTLSRHPGKTLSKEKIDSFGTKLFSIPVEYQSYYPQASDETKVSDDVAENSEDLTKQNSSVVNKRKSIPISTSKLVAKENKKTKTLPNNKNSILKFFNPSTTVTGMMI